MLYPAELSGTIKLSQSRGCELEVPSTCPVYVDAMQTPNMCRCNANCSGLCERGNGPAFCSAMPTGAKAKPAPRPGALPDQAPAANGFAAAAMGNGHSAGGLMLHGCLRRYVRSEQLAKWLCERWVPAPRPASMRLAYISTSSTLPGSI